MIVNKKNHCVEYVEQNCLSCINNFKFLSKFRALDRFKYKLEATESYPKIFVTIFPHYNLLNKHFFLSFYEQTIFSPQEFEQTIYFLFAEQSFFTKTFPRRHQMVCP